MSIASPDWTPATAQRPWLDRITTARRLLVLALFLGVLAFAAIGEMANACSREPIYRTTSDGRHRVTAQDGARVVNGKHLRCRLAWGDVVITLP
jgi:hypothetical protein